MKYHLMLEFTTEIMWDEKILSVFQGRIAYCAEKFPETKIEFPVSFQLKNVNINTSIRTNLKALYKENVVY